MAWNKAKGVFSDIFSIFRSIFRPVRMYSCGCGLIKLRMLLKSIYSHPCLTRKLQKACVASWDQTDNFLMQIMKELMQEMIFQSSLIHGGM